MIHIYVFQGFRCSELVERVYKGKGGVSVLEIGSLVDGKYRILDEVGRGGMSIVYLARNIRTNKQWAIKEVRKDGTNDYDIVRSNLIAETDILKKLEHPNLPNIIDILDDGDSFIIIMDFIEGNSLQHYLKHSGAQAEEDVVQWAIQLCDVLGYLHSRVPPIIYRDMKPANVMLKPDGNISLIDFGTAREYKETSVEDTKCLGTQGYAAPEQYGGLGQTDARTDIYCLGATMYHLVTGHNPAEPPYEMYPIRQWNPALSQGLEQIILRCTQKNPDDRYQNCEELMYALEHREQMDDAVIRRQKKNLAIFFSSLFFTILFTVGFFGFGALKNITTDKTYSARVNAAANQFGTDAEKAVSSLVEAVNLAPQRGEAYDTLLEYISSDNVITLDDVGDMNALLVEHSSSSETNLAVFQRNNPEEAAEFCYKYGRNLMLLSAVPDYVKPMSYLEYARDAQALRNPDGELSGKQQLADCLYNMCVLMQREMTLTQDVSPGAYLESWNAIWSTTHNGDNVKTDEELQYTFGDMDFAELKFFYLVASRISGSYKRFYDDGVSVAQMLDVLDLAEHCTDKILEQHADDQVFILQATDSVSFDSVRQTLDGFAASVGGG